MKPRVYLETTIASAYHETRQDAETVVRRNWTRRWWDESRHGYELVSSAAAMKELQRGDYPHQTLAVDFLSQVPMLAIEDVVENAVLEYLKHHLMPSDPGGDALHLAVASVHRCDFLLTWNCSHLANANKFIHIRKINERLGLFVPTLITPLELLGEDVP